MLRNIMVPVDGSAFSREAVLQGLRIASQSGATLRLVRVGSAPMLAGGPDSFAIESESLRQLHAAEVADLYSIAAECRAHSTVNVTASLQYGPVVDSLIGYAHRQQVDLIVMRSHARRGFARAWFGSVADGLIRESGIPVLVVRPPSVATALEDGFHFKRILVPLDGSALSEQSLAGATALARIDAARITLLRVVCPAKANDVSEAQDYLSSLLSSPLDRSMTLTRRVVVSDDVPGTILRIAEGDETDLIAISTRGRGAIARAASGSVADRILRDAPVSTMVTHPMMKAKVIASLAAGRVQPASLQATDRCSITTSSL